MEFTSCSLKRERKGQKQRERKTEENKTGRRIPLKQGQTGQDDKMDLEMRKPTKDAEER